MAVRFTCDHCGCGTPHLNVMGFGVNTHINDAKLKSSAGISSSTPTYTQHGASNENVEVCDACVETWKSRVRALTTYK